MDLKGLSWVGDMFQKIESVCTEVEETMYPDTVKYVEDQMQNIGETFKKFYSDVMHDLQPPSSSDIVKAETPPSSSDTLKAETPHVTLVHNADVAVCKLPEVKCEESVNNEAEQMLKNSDDAADIDNIVNHELGCPGRCSANGPCSVEEQCVTGKIECQCADLDMSNQDCFAAKNIQQRQDSEHKHAPETPRLNASMMKMKDSGEEFTFSAERNGSDESISGLRGLGSDSASVGVSHSEEDGLGVSDEVTEGNESVSPGAVEGSKTVAPSCWSLSGQFDEISYPMAAGKIESGDTDYHGTLVIEQVDKVNLGESCVLVEKKGSSLRLPLRDEQKSYKKKITDVFCTRRWSKGKRDKDQLAIAMWYREQSGKTLLPSLLELEGVHDSQSDNSSESDWELV